MAQLAEAVSATEVLWRVDSIPPQRFLRVESELVEVATRYPMKSLIRVRRGQEGTTAASHADETTLTPVYLGMSDQAGGGGWGVTEEGGLSADLTANDPLAGNALSLTLPGGDAWFNIGPAGSWDAVADPAIQGGGVVFKLTAPNSTARFMVADDGDGGTFEVRAEGNVAIVPTAAATRALQVYDAAGNEALRVDADGTVHIKTGGSIVADL